MTPRVAPTLADADARKRIQQDLAATLFVEAAAGTGKTSVLVSRIVSLLRSGAGRLERLVAVTFTEKAAGEMKLRLRAEIEKARSGPAPGAGMATPAGDPLRDRTDDRGVTAGSPLWANPPAEVQGVRGDPPLNLDPSSRAGVPRSGDLPPAGDASPSGDDPSSGVPQPDTAAERRRLDEALEQLELARIGTIHAFCADLLREHPIEAGVDPLFDVASQEESGRLLDLAFESWFQRELADPSEGVRRILRRRPSWWGASGPREQLRDALESLAEHRDFPAPWRLDPSDREASMDRIVAALAEIGTLSARASRSDDWLAVNLAEIARWTDENRLRESVRGRDHDALEASLRDLARSRLVHWHYRGHPGRPYASDLPREEVLARRNVVKADLDRFLDDADADLAARLREELRPAVAAYADLKRRHGKLDFLDLLLGARDLVLRHQGVREGLQRRFTHFFVDEFQDTDPLQAELLLLLAASDPAETDWRRAVPIPGKLFLVGDPKQAIYRFRRADVAVYEAVKRQILEGGRGRADAKASAGLVHLTTSFRALPGIQAAVNAAFAPHMQPSPDGTQAAYVPLEPFRSAEAERIQGGGSGEATGLGNSQSGETGIARGAAGIAPLDAARAAVSENHRGDQAPRRMSAGAAVRGGSPSPAPQDAPGDGREIGHSQRPAVVALPVPRPYKDFGDKARFTKEAIDASFADAAAAFVDWLVTRSGWTIEERDRPGAAVPIQPRHVCLLFRRFRRFHDDVTRPYVRALEVRGLPHVLVGGRSFHEREEVLALRNALAAIEWPDDELRVFATLRGPLFALGDDALLAFRHRIGRLNPLRRFDPESLGALDAPEREVAEALEILGRLHAGRNRRPIAETLTRMLDAVRAHAGLAVWPTGEQALANTLRVIELAHRYERGGAPSFRTFVDGLERDAERGEVEEAPVVEEGTEGVRMMTVHRAKGLEFPVVILADPTCAATHLPPTRHVDAARGLWAEPLCGCAPRDLLEAAPIESRRDEEEAIRIAYVAATRARDLLVVPVIGDGDGSDIGTLLETQGRAAKGAPAGAPPAARSAGTPPLFAGDAATVPGGAAASPLFAGDATVPGGGAASPLFAGDATVPGGGAAPPMFADDASARSGDARPPTFTGGSATGGSAARRSAGGIPSFVRDAGSPERGSDRPLFTDESSLPEPFPGELPEAVPENVGASSASGAHSVSTSGREGSASAASPSKTRTARNGPCWIDVLNPAVYPHPAERNHALRAPGCPEFGEDSVLERPPSSDRDAGDSVRPGLHEPMAGRHTVVWWDPRTLDLDRREQVGLRQQWILETDEGGAVAEEGIRAHERWRAGRQDALDRGAKPSLVVRTVTALAAAAAAEPEALSLLKGEGRAGIGIGHPEAGAATASTAPRPSPPQPSGSGTEHREKTAPTPIGTPPSPAAPNSVPGFPKAQPAGAPLSSAPDSTIPVLVEEVRRDLSGRPAGRRFGALVHAVLASVDLDADEPGVRAMAMVSSRILGATEKETAAAVRAVAAALAHPVLKRAAASASRGGLRRETPVLLRLPDGSLAEGVLDLAFREIGDVENEAKGERESDLTAQGMTESLHNARTRSSTLWTVVDFKTDREIAADRLRYETQVALYARAVSAATGEPARPVLLVV